MRWKNMAKTGFAARGQTQPYARPAYGTVVAK